MGQPFVICFAKTNEATSGQVVMVPVDTPHKLINSEFDILWRPRYPNYNERLQAIIL